MKKIIGISIFLLAIGFTSSVNAQSTADKVEQHVKTGAKKAGHKTAELASKGKSKITDKTYKDKVGPNGETVYIDRHSKYYYVDDRGHRHYVKKDELKDKTSGQ